MTSIQTKISFPKKRKTLRKSKKWEKENECLASPSLEELAADNRSPLKSKLSNDQKRCLKPPKRFSSIESEGSPPKLPAQSPSQLIHRIKLDDVGSPSKKDSTARKDLFPTADYLSAARKALHSSLPSYLPTREDEIEELTLILTGRLEDRKNESLYVCGPPGTGKTACLKSIISMPEIKNGYKIVFINCTGLKSSGAIFSRVCHELNLKPKSRTEKGCQQAIQKYLSSTKKMNLFILDEIDQLESRGQSILYTILEWASITSDEKASLVLVGIANSLDLTERALPRLAGHFHLKPKVIHFAPYTRDQIVTIIKHRLSEASCIDVFETGALQLLASKMATVSGDVRRALDISSRLIDVAQSKSLGEKVSVSSVLEAVNSVFSTSQQLSVNQATDSADSFPLQQKLIICSLMLIKLKSKIKEVTMARLHDVYKKVCDKRNFPILGMTEFMSLVELIEVRGIIQRQGKQISRMSKVVLQWDDKEVSSALQDKNLLASILDDKSCITI